MPTIRLFDQDAYQSQMQAVVQEVIPHAQGVQVLLSSTCFFPNEGGQSCDKGMLKGYVVQSVDEVAGKIYHTVHASPEDFTVGENVEGQIDFAFRFSNMQMHSAEHLFSGFMHKKYGYNNTGFHLSENIATMDFDGSLTPGQLDEAVQEVNRLIYQNIESRSYFPSIEEQKDLFYRSKKQDFENLRIVEFFGADVCACCAPHVKRTGEIGLFRVQSMQSHRGGIRISYLAGIRALDATLADKALLQSLYQQYSANQDTLLLFLQKQREELAALQSKVISLQEEKLQTLFQNTDTLYFIEDTDINLVRKCAVQACGQKQSDVYVFVQTVSGFRYVLCSNTDARPLQKALQDALQAKGGGQPSLVQGNVNTTKEEIQQFFIKQ
ncbi:MAG: alanyl-tRNA editing protein [Eubacteriales bacterium]|nr:alanyl-tRNA editing protein [Eubacteriales bacterium]